MNVGCGIIVDNLEIFLFVRLYRANQNNERISSGTVAKEFFACEGDEYNNHYKKNRNWFMTAKTNLVKNRIKKLIKEGLIDIEKRGEMTYYILNNNKVILKKCVFPSGRRDSILIKDKNNKWAVYEI